MEINRITPNASPNFGMAFLKPSEKVLKVLGESAEPLPLKAFVKEQAKAKYFDIIAELDSDPKSANSLIFRIVPKEGVDTLGISGEKKFGGMVSYPDHEEKLWDVYEEKLQDFKGRYQRKGLKKFIYKKIVQPIMEARYNRELRRLEKNHPEVMVHPALRAAGDEVFSLERQIDETASKRASLSKVWEA